MARQQLRSFYRPHRRVSFSGELVCPHTGTVTMPPSMTKQEFVQECDINTIMKQYSRTGMLSHVSAKAAQGGYQDLPDELDFQAAMNTALAGQQAFASLPAKLRARFDNDPAAFLGFLADPANQEEAIALGLAVKRPPSAPPEPKEAAPEPKEAAPAK